LDEFQTLFEFIGKYIPRVDSYILNDLVSGDPEYVYQAATHLIRAGGKRFRPAVVLLTARMLGGGASESRALPLAAAVEVFHTFTLIHDDIMDEDETRRGVPTVHVKYGVPTAILAGDLLQSLSYKAILEAKRRGLRSPRIVAALDALVEAAIKVSRGQGYDMRFEKELVSYHDYLEMIYLKTGALIEASAKLGAIAAYADREVVEQMGLYGRFVGVAFQIRDDILGVFGDPKVTGKPVYSDLRRGKKTILLLYALDHTSGDERRLLERIASGESVKEEDLEKAASIIRESGALAYAQELAESYVKSALDILDQLEAEDLVEDEDALRALRELALFTVRREK